MTLPVLFLRIILTGKCFYMLMMLNFLAIMLLACNRVWINSQTGFNFILQLAKCEHLCIFCNHCSNSFFAGSLNIKTVSVVKDLGIYISDNLKWSLAILFLIYIVMPLYVLSNFAFLFH